MVEEVEYEDQDAAREAIHYALNSDYTVLEFNLLDNGEMDIAEITKHVRQLERLHNDNDPAKPMDQ